LNGKYKLIQFATAATVLAMLVVFVYFTAKVITFSFFITGFTLVYFLVVSLIAYSYRFFESEIMPDCDVVIPAYNEGSHVYDTVKSVIASDYDPEKLHVIVVDDGSTDDTRKWIEKAVAEFPRQVRAIYKVRNAGKKHALSDAFRSSEAEIIITVDSDSIIEKDAIRHVVKPFTEKKIGAVAGNIRVNNISDGFIPQMMDTVLVFCYEFARSSQSRFGTVLCAAGAFSAYRREAVMPVLGRWLNQKFLGSYTSIGEDRALTSLLLRSDWNVVFQSTAVAYTNMPSKYTKVCQMMLRWMRGDIRENIQMFSYVFRKVNPLDLKVTCLQLHYIAYVLAITAPVFCLPLSMFYMISHFSESIMLGGYVLVISMIWSVIPAMIYARRYSVLRSLFAFAYGIFSLVCLSWIPLYSVLTVGNDKWMTRGRR